jgi:hypothetical protein
MNISSSAPRPGAKRNTLRRVGPGEDGVKGVGECRSDDCTDIWVYTSLGLVKLASLGSRSGKSSGRGGRVEGGVKTLSTRI